MNKSYSKIRHIQETNQRLENRLLIEQPEGEQRRPDIRMNDDKLLIMNYRKKNVQHVLSQISIVVPEIEYLSIIDCEEADFSEIDICEFDKLTLVNLKGTPNNFKEVVQCDFEEVVPEMYHKKTQNNNF